MWLLHLTYPARNRRCGNGFGEGVEARLSLSFYCTLEIFFFPGTNVEIGNHAVFVNFRSRLFLSMKSPEPLDSSIDTLFLRCQSFHP